MSRRLFPYLLAVGVLLLPVSPLHARERVQGWCEQGGNTLTVVGLETTDKAQQSFPGCTVTVWATGTVNLSTIFSDDVGTAKANPFTADGTTGLWSFYADNARYDVQLSGGGLAAPFTLSDFLLDDSAQTITTIAVIASSATPVFDVGKASILTNILTANVTSSTITNGVTGQIITIYIAQDGTGGWTFVWPTDVQLRAGGYVVSDDASAVSAIRLYFDGSNWREIGRDADEVGWDLVPVVTGQNLGSDGTSGIRFDAFLEIEEVAISNEVRFVDGNKFATIADAYANCPAALCVLVVPPADRTITSTITLSTPVHVKLGPGALTHSVQLFNITSNGVAISCTPGQTTIKWQTAATADHAIEIAADVDDVTIEHCDFDGNGVGPAIGIAINAVTTTVNSRIHIERNTFTGVPTGLGATDGLERTIINHGRLEESSISRNTFFSTASGLTFQNATNVDIIGNKCLTLTEFNCIRYTRTETNLAFIDRNITISENTGSDFWRMGIEMVAGGITNAEAKGVVVSNNTFGLWNASAPGSGNFCISFGVFVKSQVVEGNRCEKGDAASGIGIEVEGDATIEGNVVEGWLTGVTLNETVAGASTRWKVVDNTVKGSGTCIKVRGVPAEWLDVRGNTLVDCIDIAVDVGPTPLWSGQIKDNIAIRTQSFTGDDTRTWTAYVFIEPLDSSAVTVSGNYAIQTQTSPTAGFDWIAFRFNDGGSGSGYVGMTVKENKIINLASADLGTAFFVNAGGLVNGASFISNYTEDMLTVGNASFQSADLGHSGFNTDTGSTTTTAAAGYYGIRFENAIIPRTSGLDLCSTSARCDLFGQEVNLSGGPMVFGGAVSFPDLDTTPDVSGGIWFAVNNSGGTTVTTFDGGANGQLIYLWFINANTTLQDGATLNLAGATDFNPTGDDLMIFIRSASNWYELSRSAN